MTKASKGSDSGPVLRNIIERVERLREEKKSLADDEKAIFAEAKSNGFDVKTIRRLISLREQSQNDRDEQRMLLETYMTAIGMAKETPLFAAIGAMSVDLAMREQVIQAMMHLVPTTGEIIVRVGGASIRLWRDGDGDPQAEDYVETVERRTARAAKSADPIDGAGAPMTYSPKRAPRLPSLSHLQEMADRAEAASAAKRGAT